MRMKIHGYIGAALSTLTLAASVAPGATSISNSLTGFTGNSTQVATQAALGGVGLGFTSTSGFDVSVDPTVSFDAGGAHFGDAIPADAGRNYIRTTASDYANHSFTAEVTWVTNDFAFSAAYFGLGAGEYGAFRIADQDSPFAGVQLFLELNGTPPLAFTSKNQNYRSVFSAGTDVPGLDSIPGTHRLRLTYDWFRKTADFTIDANYAGGAFTADITLPTVKTLDLYGLGGWPSEPGRVYFGGDDGTTYKDLNITLTSPNTVFGDLNGSGTITVADWVILRNNLLGDFSALTNQQAYAAGDLTADKLTNQADFALFKKLYEDSNGANSFAAIAGVPEPTAFLMILSAGFGAALVLRPASRRA